MKGILFDDGDMKVTGGTLAIGDTDAQVAELVLSASPGELKEIPTVGCAAHRLVAGGPGTWWLGMAKEQLKSVGLDVKRVAMENGNIIIE